MEPLGQLQTYQHSHRGSARRRREREREREQGIENIFEKIMTENFPNMEKKLDIHVQEAQSFPNNTNPKSSTLRHIINKMQKVKDKERTLKAAREKQKVTNKGAPIRLSADFSKETF